jgi:ATP-dependent Clp protease ATP-binding subunit ClpA
MFERFTATARHTVVLSQEEARQLKHNYIGTEHVLLGLLGESEGIASRVLDSFGITRDGVRREVTEIVGPGKDQPKGHIPFTPRAKKTLELSLREALALHHSYIGTEHILLGLIREGDGVAAQIMRKHADLLAIRAAVLDAVPAGSAESGARGRRWLRRLITSEPGPAGEAEAPAEQAVLSATPAADTTLSEAARLAGSQAVGSHHLLLAALADSNSAAARVLSQLGVNLDEAKEALRGADLTGTSDEQPEDAGRRQMVIQVTDELLTVVAADPVLVKAGTEALSALGDTASSSAIHGSDLEGTAAESLGQAWQALNDTLTNVKRTADVKAAAPAQRAAAEPAKDETGDDAGDDARDQGKKGKGKSGDTGTEATG